MLWRAFKSADKGSKETGKSSPTKQKKQLKKLQSNESLAGTEATEDMFRTGTGSPRGVGEAISFDRTQQEAPSKNTISDRKNFHILTNDQQPIKDAPDSPISPKPALSKSKPSTPKSVKFSFNCANWKESSMSHVSESLLQSLDTLLTEQRQVYGVDMFQELTDNDEMESAFLQSYGYKFEETALIIFNRKRDLVIPAPGELFHIAEESAKMANAIPPGTKYAAERHRRHQVTLAMLSEEETFSLTMLLSGQESKFGRNMFDAMTDEDETEISKLLAQGYKYDDITHMIFQRKYDPSSPFQLVHPMQQQFQLRPPQSYQSRGYGSNHRRSASGHFTFDNESIHSGNSFSMNSISQSSFNSGNRSNLFQPMVPSTNSVNSSQTYSLSGHHNNDNNDGFRMPMSGTSNLFMPMSPSSSTNNSVSSSSYTYSPYNMNGNASVVSDISRANTVNNQVTGFRMPMQIPATRGSMLQSSYSSANSSVASGSNMYGTPANPQSSSAYNHSVSALTGDYATAETAALARAILAQQEPQSQSSNSSVYSSNDNAAAGRSSGSNGTASQRPLSRSVSAHSTFSPTHNPLATTRRASIVRNHSLNIPTHSNGGSSNSSTSSAQPDTTMNI